MCGGGVGGSERRGGLAVWDGMVVRGAKQAVKEEDLR